jgi:hypothetical protein
MSLLIPEIELVNTLNAVLKVLREDYINYEANGQPTRSLLFQMLGNVALGQYDYFQNAKNIILTTPESPKHIEVKLSFDQNAQQIAPSIWVALPSENNRNNSLNVGEGNYEETLFNNSPDQDEYKKVLSYRWSTTYQIVICSKNKNETTILYHLLKAMMVACITHLEHEGFSNMKIGGGDVKLVSLPDAFYTKAITLNFEYEQKIPSIFNGLVYRTLRLYWKPEGAEVADGPIEITVNNDIADSSES